MKRACRRLTVALWTTLLWSAAPTWSQTVDQGAVFAEARQIASNRWNIPPAMMRVVHGESVAASRDGFILVGETFASKFTEGMSPADARTALLFVMLHELVHVAQKDDIPMVSPEDPARRPFECQADLLAATALVTGQLRAMPLNDPAAGAQAILATVRFLKQLGAHAEQIMPTTASATGHVNRRERALAVQFGFARALSNWPAPTDQPNSSLAVARAAAQAFIGPQAREDELTWSLGICRAITRSDPDAVEAVKMHTLISKGGNTMDMGPAGASAQNFNYVVSNASARTLRVSLIALSGSYDKAAPDDFASYDFAGAAYSSVDIAPRSEGTLSGKFPFPGGDPDKRSIFLWSLPFDPNALLSASYVGKAVANANCNSGWGSLGKSRREQTVSAMARIGIAAADGFQSIAAGERNPGYGFNVFDSNVTVPGALSVVVVRNASNPFVLVDLYDGDDFEEANRVFEQARDEFKAECTQSGVQLRGNDSADRAERQFYVINLTGYSQAALSLHTRKESGNERIKLSKYSVHWGINAAD
ncbi:hypothetical protein BLA18112_00522 [Burkholderia lata]|uniref:Lipoprotein n=1 Tax=Burkholderia lata (strain ATCC 17760 / DSM 23089 / LMG 22485 / NCIMB 9086 / R18194 / 383) TaxID=482957 RepID=A0A6P2THU8_BURL3|nr:hypothetical protein [Burkholderia lata]VWC57513.1 hypothetical protein BLA18112_00522 [Burkholderia lata]